MHRALQNLLRQIDTPVIAVSGGVDSLTLAAVASEVLFEFAVVHAISPAVPPEATARVELMAARHGWSMTLVRAGEFDDPHYLANPVNRCFYCKTNLYAAIRARSDRQILSGANTDDLGEYRPGLDAARQFGVRHPYVEAGINKLQVRQIARDLGLSQVSILPSSPCLSSRVETGIPIDSGMLRFIHHVERMVADRLNPRTLRCRVRASAVVIEMDLDSLRLIAEADRKALTDSILAAAHCPANLPVRFEVYRNGSAFLVQGP
jgi:pyridinium-3,5-biscarboxylic acid mononucleotide sulfurtransferase